MRTPRLESIAHSCSEYDSIAAAQGYGISFLNGPMTVSCHNCVHWDDGRCELYIKASQYLSAPLGTTGSKETGSHFYSAD